MIKIIKAGNMEGLAKHLKKKLGDDPDFFKKCMGDEELKSYDEKARSGICAQAHKMDTGIWPGEHGGKNHNGPEVKKHKKLKFILNLKQFEK